MPRREPALQRENRLVRDGYDVTSYEDVHAQTRLRQTKLKAELDTVDRLRRQTEELAGSLGDLGREITAETLSSIETAPFTVDLPAP